MSKRIARVSKEAAERPDVQDVAKDIDTYAVLAAFASSEAGVVVFTSASKEATGTINKLILGYKKLPEIELRALIAKLEALTNFLRTFNRAATNLKLAEDFLEELLK